MCHLTTLFGVEVENSLTAATTLGLLFTRSSWSFKHFIAFKRLPDAIASEGNVSLPSCSELVEEKWAGAVLSLRQQRGFWNVPRREAWPQGIWWTVGHGRGRNLVLSPLLYVLLFLPTSAGGCLGLVPDVQWSDRPLGGVRRPRNTRGTRWPWHLHPWCCPWKH